MNYFEEQSRYTISDCLREFNSSFSLENISRFRQVFAFFLKNAVDENSLIRKLHLGYTAMRPEAYDFISSEFSWLESFRLQMGLEKKINFLETHGLHKPQFKPHIDGTFGNPQVMLNIPIQNCTQATLTSWVVPVQDIEPILLCENGTSSETKKGATPHLPPGSEFKVIASHSITDRAVLFRSDVFHMVENRSPSDDYRIMMHWWFPETMTWKIATERFRDVLI